MVFLLTSRPVGDAFVRELEFSKITLRLVDKTDKKGDEEHEHAIAKLSGPTLATLQQCLVSNLSNPLFGCLTNIVQVQTYRVDSQVTRWCRQQSHSEP